MTSGAEAHPTAWVQLRRFGPLAVAVVSVAVVWYVWGAPPVPKVHDESSYLLQAEIFARGRWTAPSPPIPEFFEQPHVQVVPAVASKYPPGHALLLALGVLAGYPPLMPLLLTAVTAALMFALAARVTNVWVALLTWTVWISAPTVLRFQPSYFSELTTTALLLASWWALLSWRDSHRRRWLLLLALAVAWGAITRPLTMLAVAIPMGIVVVRDVHRSRLWRDFGLAFATGTAVLCVLPLWSAKTTGDWRVTPIEKYRLDYLPFDKVGFTADTSSPRRGITPVLRPVYDYHRSTRPDHRVASIPRTAADRSASLLQEFFQDLRLPLLLAALAGIFFMPVPLRFAAISSATLVVTYLPYAHWAPWTLYYLETTPVLAAVTALGLWGVAERVTNTTRARQIAIVGAVLVIVAAFPAFAHWRSDHRARSALDRLFLNEISRLPQPAIVFVRYSPRVAQHIAVVSNHPDLDSAPVWVVHHLGSRNEALRRLAPERHSFDFEEDQLVYRVRR